MNPKALKAYASVLETLDPSGRAVSCASGKVDSPLPSLRSPPGSYGYPPALVPIWSDGSGPLYLGAWQHFFVPRRKSYVELKVGAAPVREVARTFEQMVWVVAFKAVAAQQGVAPAVRNFLAAAGVLELDSPAAAAGPAAHPAFLTSVPRSLADPKGYDGDFPIFPDAPNACAYELSLPPGKVAPGAFKDALKAQDFGRAWLCLNAPGWELGAAESALQELRKAAGKDAPEAFHQQTEAWLLEHRGRTGRY